MRSELYSVYQDIQQRLYKLDKKYINDTINTLLDTLEKNNIWFDIYLGYYDYEGFVFDKLLNGVEGAMLDKNFDYVDYLTMYRDNLEFPLVVELQIMYEKTYYNIEEGCTMVDYMFSFVEYDGNEFIYDIKEDI